MKPLEGLTILDFSQLLAGPYAALRLADLGARVIKIENPNGGDLSRTVMLSNLCIDGDNATFHSVNRGKESVTLDLKSGDDLDKLYRLIKKSDAMLLNFRPGVAKRLGIDYETVIKQNPGLVYGEITGYGTEGPWAARPGQDLLVQAVSGLAWLNGNADQPPMPMGLSIADMMAGEHIVQGMLAALVRRGVTGEGAYVQASMIESTLDIQFEGLTTFLNDGHELPQRSAVNNANAYVAAPYGVYETKNGYIALAMGSIITLAELLGCEKLLAYPNKEEWSTKRDEIKAVLADHLLTRNTEDWLGVLEPADIWCADVLDWNRLTASEGFKALDMLQETVRSDGLKMKTLRCPIRIDGERYKNQKGAPKMNEHNADIDLILNGE